jgi:salicylate synthetase
MALSDIAQGRYGKVIPSRALEIEGKIDMPATLLAGRHANDPARTFPISHGGYRATGFSPELVLSVDNGKVMTEPLAGTRSAKGTKKEVETMRNELLNDPKEIVEHVISVREAIEELRQLCPPETIKVEDLMPVRARGSVQHLGSSVAGMLSPEKDIWDAFNVLFPSITASGIPKPAALEAIQHLEDKPRELYLGAVFMIEDSKSFEAALVLRTVCQDKSRSWIQAGAGVISQSNPQRELMETREKLASVAPFVVLAGEV